MTQPQKKMRCGGTNNHNAQSQGFDAPFIQRLVIKHRISNAVAIDYEFNKKRFNTSYLTWHTQDEQAEAQIYRSTLHILFSRLISSLVFHL